MLFIWRNNTNKVWFACYVVYRRHKTTCTCPSGALRRNGIKTQFSTNLRFLPFSFHTHSLQWRHNECDGISNHQPHDCLLNACSGEDQRKHQTSTSLVFVTSEFPAQMTSNVANVSIWWRHHVLVTRTLLLFWGFAFRLSNNWMMQICHVAPWKPRLFCWDLSCCYYIIVSSIPMLSAHIYSRSIQ